MPYAIVHTFAGATKEQYEAAVAAVHPPGGLPEGQIVHIAGPSDDGWVIVAVHDTKESWERFRDTVLMPAMQKGIEGGLVGPPDETAFEVSTHQTA